MGIANHTTQETDNSGIESGSDCPTLNAFFGQRSPDSVKSMTSFVPEKFEGVWLLMAEHVARFWNTGRGRRYSEVACSSMRRSCIAGLQ